MIIHSVHTASAAVLARWTSRRFRRAVGSVVAATASLMSFGVAGPSAFAMRVPPGGGASGPVPPTVKVISSGVTVWQVAVIAAGAALLGAAVALLSSRLRPGRRMVSSRTA
jgi:hypothetical protein